MKCQRFFIVTKPDKKESATLTFLHFSIYLKNQKRYYYVVESCFGHNPHTTANSEPEILFFLFPVQSSGSVKQKFAQDLLSNKTDVFIRI